MKATVKYIWEKEYPEDGKHNKKFYQNNDPQRFSPRKIFKTIYIHGKKIRTISNSSHNKN
jgi:hypothetical protein